MTLTSDVTNNDEPEVMSWIYPYEFFNCEEARKFAIKVLEDLNIDEVICPADLSYIIDHDGRFYGAQ